MKTDDTGDFTFVVPYYDSFTLTAEHDSDVYADTYINTFAGEENVLVSLMPTLDDDEMMIALTWGGQRGYSAYKKGLGTPQDLDLFLYFPVSTSRECMVYYGRNKCGNAKLEVSDSVIAPKNSQEKYSATKANGLEVIRINKLYRTTYTLYVQNYDLDQPFQTSDMKISIFNSDGLMKTVFPPTSCRATSNASATDLGRSSSKGCSFHDTPLIEPSKWKKSSSLPIWAHRKNIHNAEILRVACFDHSSGISILHECQRYMSMDAFSHLGTVSGCPIADDVCTASKKKSWWCSTNVRSGIYSCPEGAESMVFCPKHSPCVQPKRKISSRIVDPTALMCTSNRIFKNTNNQLK